MTGDAPFFESLVLTLAEKHGFDVSEDAVERDPSGDEYRVTLWDPVVDEVVSFRVSRLEFVSSRLNREAFARGVARQVESARRRVDQRILGPQPEPELTPLKVYNQW